MGEGALILLLMLLRTTLAQRPVGVLDTELGSTQFTAAPNQVGLVHVICQHFNLMGAHLLAATISFKRTGLFDI